MNKVDFIAVPFDRNSEKKGASQAPHLLYDYLRGRFSDIEWSAKFNSHNFLEIEEFAKAQLETMQKPFFIGGDHSITLPLFRAVSVMRKKPDFIYLDAHFDADKLEKVHNSSFVNYLHEFSNPKILNIGVRPKLTAPEFIDSISSMEFSEALLKEKLFAFKNPVYLSIDVDVLEPALFPGVGIPEAFGLTSREFYDALKLIFKTCNVAAVDLVEFNPSIEKKLSLEAFASIARLVEKFWD